MITFDLDEGLKQAAIGMSKAAAAERAQAWNKKADLFLLSLPLGCTFSADDLIEAIGLVDPESAPTSNNAVGAWMRGKSQAGQIEHTGGWTPSKRALRHGNPQRVWRVL